MSAPTSSTYHMRPYAQRKQRGNFKTGFCFCFYFFVRRYSSQFRCWTSRVVSARDLVNTFACYVAISAQVSAGRLSEAWRPQRASRSWPGVRGHSRGPLFGPFFGPLVGPFLRCPGRSSFRYRFRSKNKTVLRAKILWNFRPYSKTPPPPSQTHGRFFVTRFSRGFHGCFHGRFRALCSRIVVVFFTDFSRRSPFFSRVFSRILSRAYMSRSPTHLQVNSNGYTCRGAVLKVYLCS